MTNDERNPKAECRRALWCAMARWSFGFRYSFGFRHSSFGFENRGSWVIRWWDLTHLTLRFLPGLVPPDKVGRIHRTECKIYGTSVCEHIENSIRRPEIEESARFQTL